ncbi:MAG: GldG family protein [Deltaproteobacteria bacterium]|nr:GldG family protein [Deltaproteobacteria bacterium]
MSAQPRARLNLLLTAVLGLVVVVLVNYISSRHYKRWDWTSHGLFTLSDRSQQALRELDQDVDIYVFLGRDEQDFADVETLLEEYKAVTDRIRFEWVDPDRDRARYQVLADKFGIDSWLAGDVTLSQVPVVVTSGERKWKVERHQLIVEDFETFEDADGHKLDLQSERALTGAILEVTTGDPNKVCVAMGHGEWEVGAYGERSFDPVARELEWEKIEVEPFEIRTADVPETCDALFVISPQRPFSKEEVGIVERYLNSGGNLLLTFDPVLKKEKLTGTGFEGALEARGIIVGVDLVIENDTAQQLPGNPGDLFLVTNVGTHRLVDTIRKRGGGILLAVARSVDVADGSDTEVLFRTSPAAVAETDLRLALDPDAKGKPTPPDAVPLAVAWEYVPPLGDDLQPVKADGPTPGRLLVMGDSDWMSSELLENPQLSNIDLLSSAVGWLTQREALINIAPRKTNARAVIMSDADLQNLLFRVVVLLPLAALIAGFGVWWSRRS